MPSPAERGAAAGFHHPGEDLALDRENAHKLDRLLRTELSAVETYTRLLELVREDPFLEEIESILREHRSAAEALRNYIVARKGAPSEGGGVWDMLTHLVSAGAARLFGNERALRSLRHAEERSCQAYVGVLEDPLFDTECKVLVHQLLLPKQRRHIQVIDRILRAEATDE